MAMRDQDGPPFHKGASQPRSIGPESGPGPERGIARGESGMDVDRERDTIAHSAPDPLARGRTDSGFDPDHHEVFRHTSGHTLEAREDRLHHTAAVRVEDTRTRIAIADHPIHPMVVNFPIAFLIGALVTDLVHLSTADLLWARLSYWLIVAGWMSGGAAAVFGVLEFLTVPKARRLLSAYFHAAMAIIMVGLAVINWYIREDGAAVPPVGVGLSVATVVFVFLAGWLGGTLVYKHRVGSIPREEEPVHAPAPRGRIRGRFD